MKVKKNDVGVRQFNLIWMFFTFETLVLILERIR